MRLLTAGLQVRVLPGEPVVSKSEPGAPPLNSVPALTREWGFVYVHGIKGFAGSRNWPCSQVRIWVSTGVRFAARNALRVSDSERLEKSV